MNQIKKGVSEAKNNAAEKEITVEKEKKTGNLDIKSLLIGILATISIVLLVVVIILATRKNTNPVYNSDAGSMEGAIADSYKEVRMGKEYKEAVAAVTDVINNIKNNNGYIHVYTGEEEYDTYIYNKKGEAFAVGNVSTNMTVFRNDGVAVKYTDMIAQTEELDILQLILNSLNAIDNNKIEMFESKSDVAETSEYEGYHEYVAVFDSYDDIRNLYSSMSTEYADIMVEDIKAAFHEGTTPTFKIYYMISEGGGLTVACHLIENEETYLNWYIDGYLNVYDWELPEEWYTYDFSDSDKSEEMLTSLASSLEEMLAKYGEENGVLITDGSDENTETDAHEGHNHSDTTDENGDQVYTYGGELDLSEVPSLTLEEAQEMLENSEAENPNIEGLEQIEAETNVGTNVGTSIGETDTVE